MLSHVFSRRLIPDGLYTRIFSPSCIIKHYIFLSIARDSIEFPMDAIFLRRWRGDVTHSSHDVDIIIGCPCTSIEKSPDRRRPDVYYSTFVYIGYTREREKNIPGEKRKRTRSKLIAAIIHTTERSFERIFHHLPSPVSLIKSCRYNDKNSVQLHPLYNRKHRRYSEKKNISEIYKNQSIDVLCIRALIFMENLFPFWDQGKNFDFCMDLNSCNQPIAHENL